jgi:hypothetical protein
MDESDIDDLPPWDDDSTDEEKSVVDTRDISTQKKNDTQDDPEHPLPGNDT